MREAIKRTVWFTGGCKSWYIDKSGLPNLCPWFPVRYLQEMRRPVFEEYRLIKWRLAISGLNRNNSPLETALSSAG